MKPSYIYILIFSALFATTSCKHKVRSEKKQFSENDRVSGQVINVIDGDTYDLLTEKKQTIRVRMEGIDAPERGMPFYKVSKNYLGALCYKKNVILEISGVDRYGRYLGYSYINDSTELGIEMIKGGMAWHFKEYNNDIELAEAEENARKDKKGLWAVDNPMPPWVNRKLHRQGVSTKEYFEQSNKQVLFN